MNTSSMLSTKQIKMTKAMEFEDCCAQQTMICKKDIIFEDLETKKLTSASGTCWFGALAYGTKCNLRF